MGNANFDQIRQQMCVRDPRISSGRMMRSEAITYQGKVFAFFSTKQKLVVRLGKSFQPTEAEADLQPFNPFKNRSAMTGWYEIPFADHRLWEHYCEQALARIQSDVS